MTIKNPPLKIFNLKAQPKCNFHLRKDSKIVEINKNIKNSNVRLCLNENYRLLTLKSANNLSCVNKNLNILRFIHTTPTRYNPIISIFLRNVAKVASIFIGR